MIQFIKTIQIALNMKLNITNRTDRPAAYINCSLELINRPFTYISLEQQSAN